MIKEAIGTLVDGNSLSIDEAVAAMDEIMSGEATPAQFGAFVTALRMKGETVDEIAGLARVMRDKSRKVDFAQPTVDTCGTGGDSFGTFNISTAAAFVAAGAGLKVAKHGNRAMTSHCGSADVLEAMGVKIDLPPEGVRKCLEQAGIGFMFAQIFHPAMKYAAAPRREIGIRSVFNFLGPLTNPAGAEAQVIGVSDLNFAPRMAEVLLKLGTRHALVTRGREGLDEISISGETDIWEVKDGAVTPFSVTPEQYGIERVDVTAIKGGAAEDNAAIIRSVLQGDTGPRRDVVLLNAAAGLVAGTLSSDLAEGIERAAQAIDGGAAGKVLADLIRVSNDNAAA